MSSSFCKPAETKTQCDDEGCGEGEDGEGVGSIRNNKSNVSDIISGFQVFVWLGCLVARLLAWLVVWLPGRISSCTSACDTAIRALGEV